jgi:hypothetical protein
MKNVISLDKDLFNVYDRNSKLLCLPKKVKIMSGLFCNQDILYHKQLVISEIEYLNICVLQLLSIDGQMSPRFS